MVFCPQPVVYETLRDQIRELFQIEPFIYFDLDEVTQHYKLLLHLTFLIESNKVYFLAARAG